MSKELQEELVEQGALISALEAGLLEATNTIDESAAEIRRLQNIIREYEMKALHLGNESLSLKNSGRIDLSPDDQSTIERASVNSKTMVSGTHKAMLLKSGKVIVDDDGEDEMTIIEPHAVKALNDKVFAIEFENQHMKEKLEKILHTVDCLNDDIAELSRQLDEKDAKIAALEGKKAPNPRPASAGQVAAPPLVATKAPKRLWGPAAKAALAKAPVDADTATETSTNPSTPTPPPTVKTAAAMISQAAKASAITAGISTLTAAPKSAFANTSIGSRPVTPRARALSGLSQSSTSRKTSISAKTPGSGENTPTATGKHKSMSRPTPVKPPVSNDKRKIVL